MRCDRCGVDMDASSEPCDLGFEDRCALMAICGSLEHPAFYGYFDDPQQVSPAFDPGLSVDCPYCGKKLSAPVVTTSMMRSEHPDRSYFYRAHKACLQDATQADIDRVEAHPLFDTKTS